MELRNVEVKRAAWSPAKLDKEGAQTAPATLTLTLVIADPLVDELAALVAFAEQGPCTWTLGGVQAELATRTRS